LIFGFLLRGGILSVQRDTCGLFGAGFLTNLDGSPGECLGPVKVLSENIWALFIVNISN